MPRPSDPGPTGHLWAVIQSWMDAQQFPPSQNQLADRVNISRSKMTEWKYARTMPSAVDLGRLADVLRVPFAVVSHAAQQDHGYEPASLPNFQRHKG